MSNNEDFISYWTYSGEEKSTTKTVLKFQAFSQHLVVSRKVQYIEFP